ncbi:MAG TPA: HD domain-containing protein [Steroidobacteraceae bacterium]|jgi:phosphonate degradation associated HDIG domain protein
MDIVEEIAALFSVRGKETYFGEPVSMREHSLQAAHFAGLAHAPENLVLAALLHDVGHLVVSVPDDLADWTEDAHHEEVGARWLVARFPPSVSEPVRLHVPAKRYLCAVSPEYFDRLSDASKVTLNLQGGPMNDAEVRRFKEQPYHREAVRVRLCDDQGKVAGLVTQALEDYLPLIRRLAL